MPSAGPLGTNPVVATTRQEHRTSPSNASWASATPRRAQPVLIARQRVAAELAAAGAKIAFTQADVGTEAACLDFVNGAAQKFGRLDILINNAGIRKYEKVDEVSAASWNEILDVNLMSYVFCAKAAVPLMRRNKGGAIVNVASVRSVVAGGGNLQYDTTKAAVAGLTRALAADHSPEGIRVNAVGPGPIFTRSISAASQRPARPPSSITPRPHKAPC
jgi:NAD(P)-dependent dehydrogenase (short-subunit alcohol dehydrogenase family)